MLHLYPADHELLNEQMQDDSHTFLNYVENVEFPVEKVELPAVSLQAGRSKIRKLGKWKYTRYDPHLMLYLVGEELGHNGSPSPAAAAAAAAAGDTVFSTVVFPTLPEKVVILPEEVVDAVLQRLPAAAQARCRAVCKAWLAMLDDPGFLRRSFLHSLSRTTPPPMCAAWHSPDDSFKPPSEIRRRIVPLYKTLKVDLSFLPEVFHATPPLLHKFSLYGLLCMSVVVDEGMHFCVFNPVNQSFKVLPMLPKRWSCEDILWEGTGTATGGSIPGFKIYVPGVRLILDSQSDIFWARYSWNVVIYSSITGEWTGISRAAEHMHIEECPHAACNGVVYTAVGGTSLRLLQLNTDRGRRYLCNLPLPVFKESQARHTWGAYCLAWHRGRLLCCRDDILMWDDAREVWVEIAGSCPPQILPPGDRYTAESWFSRRTGEISQFLMLEDVHVFGDLVVFFYERSFHYTDQGQGDCSVHVAYDMLRRCWLKVPQSIAQAGHVFQPMPNLRL